MTFLKRTLAALALGTAFTATGSAADIDPFWPSDSKQVMRLNIKQVLESDLIKKYALAQLKQAMEGQDAQKTLKALGLDPLKDIESVSAGFWGDNPQDMHGLMVLRGKFDGQKLFAAIEKEAAKNGDKVSIVKEGDTQLVKIVVDQIPEPVYGTLANDTTILVGTDKKLVLTGVKVADKKETNKLDAALSDLVKAADEKASMYFVGLSSGKVGDIPPNPLIEDAEKLKKQMEALKSSSMTLRVTGDVSMEFLMSMKDKDAATDFGDSINDMLNKAKAFMPFITQQAPQAKAIVDDLKKSLKSSVDDKNIKMTVKLSGDAIGKAVGTEE
jgi:hypothetical protein